MVFVIIPILVKKDVKELFCRFYNNRKRLLSNSHSFGMYKTDRHKAIPLLLRLWHSTAVLIVEL